MSDFEKLFEDAPCGYLVTAIDGLIEHVNATFLKWTGYAAAELVGRRFHDLLSPGGRIYHETHVAPMLGLQGFVREIALELRASDGRMIPLIANADVEDATAMDGGHIRLVVIDATERRSFERELQRTQRRLERLQRTTSAFAVALTRDEVALASLAEILDGVKGDHGFLAVLERGRLHVLRSQPHDDAIARAWEDADIDGLAALEPAVRLRGPVFLENSDGTEVGLPPVRADGGQCMRLALLPMAAEGTLTGLMCVASSEHSTFQSDERSFLVLFAELTAQALDRARLHDAVAVSAEQMGFLAELTRALDEPTSFRERAQRLVDLVVPTIADYATVEAPRIAQGAIAVAHRNPDLVETLRNLRAAADLSADQPHSLAAARASHRPQIVTEISEEMYDRYGLMSDEVDMLRQLAPRSYVGLPLLARGTLVGTLMLVCSESDRRFRQSDLGYLADIADRAALALENARLYDHERWVAQSLQRYLLTRPLAEDPRIEMDATYRAGAELVEIGGDFYDAFLVSPNRVALAVGDVVGRGIPAATIMGQLRTALRAYAIEGHGPAWTLDRLDAFAQSIQGASCSSVAYAELELDTGELWYSCAGHPPPVLVTADGQVTVLWEGRSPLLGVDLTTPKPQACVHVPRSARLLLYTDGLVEARSRPLDRGIDELAQHLGHQGDVDIDTLVAKLDVDDSHTDDVCVLSLTRR